MNTNLIHPLLIVISSAILSFGQTAATQSLPGSSARSDKPKTDLEQFQERYGAVIVQGFSKTALLKGVGGSFSIYVKEFKNAANNTKVKGLVVDIETDERFSSNARSFIEYGEVESLIKGIEYISKLDKGVTTLANFEAKYKTKDDFSITVFNSSYDGKLSVAITIGNIGRKTIYLEIAQLPELMSQFQKAKLALDAL
jgi:hypothetical protein